MKRIKCLFLCEWFIITLIVINSLLTLYFLYTPIIPTTLIVGDYILTLCFVIEMFVKISYYKKGFWESTTNIFDCFLITLSTIPIIFNGVLSGISMLLLLRVFRLFKFFRIYKLIPNHKRLMLNLKMALRTCIGLILGLCVIFFIASIVFCSLYKEISPEYFGTPIDSLYSVFRLFSIEGWYEMPDEISINLNRHWGLLTKLLFSSFIFISMFINAFVTSMFVDEMASDNNVDVLNKLNEIEMLIKHKK